MIRILFYFISITLLAVYVPDNTRKELKNIIASVYGRAHTLVEKTFPDGSNKLKELLPQVEYIRVKQIDFKTEQEQLQEPAEKANEEDTHLEGTNEQKPSFDPGQFQAVYKNGRSKLVELMNILGEADDDTNK